MVTRWNSWRASSRSAPQDTLGCPRCRDRLFGDNGGTAITFRQPMAQEPDCEVFRILKDWQLAAITGYSTKIPNGVVRAGRRLPVRKSGRIMRCDAGLPDNRLLW